MYKLHESIHIIFNIILPIIHYDRLLLFLSIILINVPNNRRIVVNSVKANTLSTAGAAYKLYINSGIATNPIIPVIYLSPLFFAIFFNNGIVITYFIPLRMKSPGSPRWSNSFAASTFLLEIVNV